jgi:hypothetical protein
MEVDESCCCLALVCRRLVDAGRHLTPAPHLPSTINSQCYAYKKTPACASLNSFADDLKLLPIQPRTQDAYLACVRQLAEFYDRSPELVSIEEIRRYFIHLKSDKKVARQTSTQALCAIKMFWEKTLHRPWPRAVQLVRAQPQVKLPVVLSASTICAGKVSEVGARCKNVWQAATDNAEALVKYGVTAAKLPARHSRHRTECARPRAQGRPMGRGRPSQFQNLDVAADVRRRTGGKPRESAS